MRQFFSIRRIVFVYFPRVGRLSAHHQIRQHNGSHGFYYHRSA